MEDQYQDMEQSANMNTNQGFTTEGIVKYRLDTTQMMENIEMFLKGEYDTVVVDNKTGATKFKRIMVTRPKANKKGVQSILAFIQTVISPPVVQGNFMVDGAGYSEEYTNYIVERHKDFASDLIENSKEWEMTDNDINLLINLFVSVMIPFMTRLKANKERESYGVSMRSVESNTVGNQRRGWNPFRRG